MAIELRHPVVRGTRAEDIEEPSQLTDREHLLRVQTNKALANTAQVSEACAVLARCLRDGAPFEDAWHLALEKVKDTPANQNAMLFVKPSYEAAYLALPDPVPPYDPRYR